MWTHPEANLYISVICMGVSGGQHTSRSGYRLAAADWHSFYSEYFAVVVSVS